MRGDVKKMHRFSRLKNINEYGQWEEAICIDFTTKLVNTLLRRRRREGGGRRIKAGRNRNSLYRNALQTINVKVNTVRVIKLSLPLE